MKFQKQQQERAFKKSVKTAHSHWMLGSAMCSILSCTAKLGAVELHWRPAFQGARKLKAEGM